MIEVAHDPQATPWGLSSREIDVLTRIVEGESSKEIGKVLGISYKTVEVYSGRASEKMGGISRTRMAVLFDRYLRGGAA